MNVNFSEALRYPRLDPEWKTKMLLAIALMFVPILNFAVTGFAVGIIQQVRQGLRGAPMPATGDIGGLFMRGLKLGLGVMAYSLIVLIPYFIGYGVFFVMLMMSQSGGRGRPGAMPDLPGWAIAVLVICGILFVIGLILLALINPALQINFARKETIGSSFQLGELRAIMRKNIRDYLKIAFAPMLVGIVVYGLLGCASFAASSISPAIALALSCFYLLLTPVLMVLAVYGMWVMAHAYGQYDAAPA
jgi:hypothetical protein